MSLKKIPDWKGKIQWVSTNRKPKFKVKKKIQIKQAQKKNAVFCSL